MPFYRITILLQNGKVVHGIRQHENSYIDYVTNVFRIKAVATYGNEICDIEVAMLSKNSTAVKSYLEKESKRIKDKKQWRKSSIPTNTTNYRKLNKPTKPPLGELRKENKEK